jgi:hypothetical protein
MAAGTWKKLESSGLTYDLVDAGGNQIILEYSESCVWDPNTEQVLFCGQGHYAAFKFISYNAQANEWRRMSDPPWTGGIGHSYDHNAIDEARGRFYFVKYSGSDIYEYNTATSSWRTLTSIPSSVGNFTCCKALEYFPELNGLVVVGGGNVALYNTSTGQWSNLASGLAMGIYEHFAEYSPAKKAMFLGGGASDRNIYKLDANGKVTKLNNAPIGMGAHQSTVTVDPVSGTFLVNSADRELYTYDITSDRWEKIYPYLPFRTFTTIATPVSSHGVVLYFAADYAAAPQVYLYKHAAGSTGIDGSPVGSHNAAMIKVSPNPFTTVINIAVSHQLSAVSKNILEIYNVTGKLVGKLTADSRQLTAGITWNPTGLAPGIYFLKLQTGNRQYTKKILLQK